MTTHRLRRKFSPNSLLLLAPTNAALHLFQGPVIRSAYRYSDLIAKIQRFRGEIYLEDGAIQPSSLTPDGRHVSGVDDASWHLVTLGEHDDVLGCSRFRQHSGSSDFQDLCLRDSALAKCEIWGAKLKSSILADIRAARKIGFHYVEVGGWAIAHELRGTTAALQSVLATFAWSQVLGGAIGVSTATERNGSASILRKLGGRSVSWNGRELPCYYDEQYQCQMEVLRFDSRLPSPRYSGAIEELRRLISALTVVQSTGGESPYPKLPFVLPEVLPCQWPEPLAVAC